MNQQGSLFSKAYHPLAQQYFSAGSLPPPLLHPLLGGCTSMFTSGGPLPCSLLGVHFHFHFWGSTSMFTSGGVHFCVHFQGVHFHVHFWGVPCDLSDNALLYCYRMPQCIMGIIHMGPAPPEFNRLTDKQTRVKTLPTRTTWRAVKMHQF